MRITEEERARYEFRGSGLVQTMATGAVLALRYLGVIGWSWYVVVPVAILAGAIMAAIVSTVIHQR